MFKCDVSKEDDVKNAIDGTIKHFGAIHVALACAGVLIPVRALTSTKVLDTQNFQKVYSIFKN